MTFAKWIAWLGALAMTAVLLNGFISGNFAQDGGELLRNPWGIVSVVDLYVGFVLFSLWIGFREKSVVSAVIWIVLMMVFGFFTASVYILINLYRHDGDWAGLLFGARKDQIISQLTKES